ncbi:PREDICTED: calbindin [Propithecus coquereli]|uniref:calbindin n=1 Tax=Propithecus coquereli TaxID=379532 RepID=UPI00063F33AC|nr:PREDICTED: calbindin [Propithecus coquereli]
MAESHLQSSLITASQFFEIWLHFDADGSGYLEGKELQNLIQELQQARKKAGLELSPEMKTFVDQYGQRDDGKIGIVELAHVLPTEENFLLLFRCQQLKSCEEFMKTWRKYDTDHSGFIETEELKNFLKDLLEKANKVVDDTKLAEYTDLMVRLEKTVCSQGLMKYYDVIANSQGMNRKDICQKLKQDLDINNITTYKKNIMALSDGGKLYRTDLALILCAGDN